MVANLLLFCCFLGVALARTEAEIKIWFTGHGMLCFHDFPVTDEELLMMDKYTIPDSKNAKCLVACIFSKAEWLDDKGMFIEENAIKLVEEDLAQEHTKIEKAKKLLATCKAVNDETYTGGDGKCERAAALAKCLIENTPKVGLKLP